MVQRVPWRAVAVVVPQLAIVPLELWAGATPVWGFYALGTSAAYGLFVLWYARMSPEEKEAASGGQARYTAGMLGLWGLGLLTTLKGVSAMAEAPTYWLAAARLAAWWPHASMLLMKRGGGRKRHVEAAPKHTEGETFECPPTTGEPLRHEPVQ